MAKRSLSNDTPFPKTWFVDKGDIPRGDLERILRGNPNMLSPVGDGVFPFTVISYLWSENQRLKQEVEGNPLEEKENLSNKISKEKLIKIAIETRLLAGVLVQKAEAEQRIIMTLASASSSITSAIQEAAQELYDKFGGNVREYVELLTKHFREANEKLFESSQNISWEDHGSSESLQKRMKMLSETDPDFLDSYQEVYNE